jgi:hypothetical protein
MSTSKHPKARRPSDMDLGMDPGIGSSKGTFKEGDELDEGANTFEGDVANDLTPQGGIDKGPKRQHRGEPRSQVEAKRTVGKNTHAQQISIIEGRENTKSAGKDFDAEAELKRSPQEREAFRKGANLKAPQRDIVDPDERNMLAGEHQQSSHHKSRPGK